MKLITSFSLFPLFALSAFASPVSITSVDLYTLADYSTYSATPDLYDIAHTSNGLDFAVDQHVTSLPLGTSTQTSALKQSLQQNTYNLQDNATDFAFQVDLTARHDASMWSNADGYGLIYFGVSEDMTYSLEGQFNTEAGSANNQTIFSAGVYEVVAGVNQPLYQNTQWSVWTSGEAFTLGQNGGDTYNSLTVPADYTLLAGHQYLLAYSDWFQSYPNPVEQSASGYVRFSAQSAAPAVPEPASLALMGLGLCAAALAARKRGR